MALAFLVVVTLCGAILLGFSHPANAIISHAGDIFVTSTNITGGTSKWVTDGLFIKPNTTIADNVLLDAGYLNMSGNRIIEVGELILEGLTQAYDVVPVTDAFYTLGNATHYWNEAYINTLWAVGINASAINTTDIQSTDANVTGTLTVAGYEIKDDSGNMVVDLG
jgi:hypothetical protein